MNQRTTTPVHSKPDLEDDIAISPNSTPNESEESHITKENHMNSISATKILLFLFVGLVMTFVSTTIIGNVYFPDAMDVTTDSAYLSMLNDLQNFLGLAFSALLGALAERIPQGRESK